MLDFEYHQAGAVGRNRIPSRLHRDEAPILQSDFDGSARAKHILLVDDDPMVRALTATLLKNVGYIVIEADSGFSGLDRFAECRNTIDLILSDVVMPNMTGVEMIEQTMAADPSIPVMLMTGCFLDSTLPPNIPVLLKPFTPERLLKAIDASLRSDRASSTRAEDEPYSDSHVGYQ